MYREQIRKFVLQHNGQMSQKALAIMIGITQSEISRCCEYYGIEWKRQHRDQKGNKNHSYKDGLGRSTVERATRLIVINSNRSLFICERCSFECKDQELPRHHKDRDRSNNINENIEVLCWGCHNKEHMKERERYQDGRFIG